MPDAYQNPYRKKLRQRGETIPAEDHNKQERQIECLTEAVGNYNFGNGSIQVRLQALELGPVIEQLNDINDVNVPSPSDGQFLSYDDNTNTWIAVTLDLTTDLDSLTDVDLTGAQNGDSLVKNGATWVPRNRAIAVASDIPGGPNEVEVTEVSEIRFITQTAPNEDHFVNDLGDGVVYIGAAPTPDPLGGDLTGLPALVTGRMSQSNINYPPALAAGDIYDRITQSSTFTFSHGAGQFNNASLGNLILSINGVDVANIDLAANFQEADRGGSQDMNNYDTTGTGSPITNGVVSFVGGDLTLVSVGTTSLPSDVYQQGTAQINVTAAALRQGYNTVQLRHVAGGTNSTNELVWFYDTNAAGGANDPDITGLSLVEDTPSLNNLSGVPYYGSGSTFDLDLTLNDGFDNVYHQSEIPVTLDSSDFGFFTAGVDINDASVSGLSTPPDISETMAVNNFGIILGGDVQNAAPEVEATPRDPYGSYTPVTDVTDFVLMSALPDSTDVFEGFVDERYRLPPSTNFDVPIAGMPGPPSLWDSTIALTDVSRTDELQVYDEFATPSARLIHPVTDLSSAARNPQPAPDYSSLAAGTNFVYRRVFRSTIGARTNGILTFPGLAEADLVSDITLRIKIPGRTVWLDLTAPFNGGTFPTGAPLVGGSDGEGCRINIGVNSLDINNSIEFSLGAIGTDGSSDFQLILEIGYADSGTAEVLGTGAGVSLNW